MTSKNNIGLAISAKDSTEAVRKIIQAEELGVPSAWLTTGGARMDGLTLLSAAAIKTRSILLGTSIIPIWPRHPIAVAQQAQVLAQISPGRFRLGIGPSHKDGMIQTFGADFKAPLGHMREYIRILKSLLQHGEVDMDGKYYVAHAKIDEPLDVPIMASALRRRSFELCGGEADGAISWICPGTYLRDVAIPAIHRGAERANRQVPPLIAHTMVAIHSDADQVRRSVRDHMSFYVRFPFYMQMFLDAGFPEAQSGEWSDSMIDAVAIYGSETEVVSKLRTLLCYSATELIVSPILIGPDLEASWVKTATAIGKM